MADTLKKVLTEYGVDMKKTMERFVGDEIYMQNVSQNFFLTAAGLF